MCRGIPSFSAQCKCPKLGGFAMMASATKGLRSCSGSWSSIPIHSSTVCFRGSTPRPLPVSMHDLQVPRKISAMPFLLFPTSPLRNVSKPGIKPGFLTIKAMSSAGSPPMLKNSSPFSMTKSLNVGCVASRTLWPYVSLSTLPRATKGCTSPREPTTWITTLRGGGGSCPGAPPRNSGTYGGGGAGSRCDWVSCRWICGRMSCERARLFWSMVMLTRPSSATMAFVPRPLFSLDIWPGSSVYAGGASGFGGSCSSSCAPSKP